MQKIILFGGTFDPIHQGHINIALAAKRQLNADKVIFILSRAPRWKTPSVTTEHRLAMLKLAIEGIEGFEYSTYEIDKNTDFDYSIDTARHFVNTSKEKHEDVKYYWLIGSDQVVQLDRWIEIEELASIVQFIYYSREVEKSTSENIERFHIEHIVGETYNISSTSIRKIDSSDIPDKVFDYMAKNSLYFFSKLKEYLTPKRLEHSISVARLARDITKNTRHDYNKAFYAGLFHDIGKYVGEEQGKKMMEEFYPSYIDMPVWSWHQFLGVIIARDVFNIEDSDILEAICFHATGKAHMSPIGKIVYASDKIEPTRGFDSSDLIASCLNDYHQGFIDVLIANKEYLEQKGCNHPRLTIECFKHYLEK